jgi:hypothetical protein
MKFSTVVLLFVFAVLAFTQAAPGDAKPAPGGGKGPKGKPKPKPKPKRHHLITSAPTMAPTMAVNSDTVDLVSDVVQLQMESHDTANHVGQAGIVAVLCGVAVACVVAIVAVLRAPSTHTHELLPDDSETAAI